MVQNDYVWLFTLKHLDLKVTLRKPWMRKTMSLSGEPVAMEQLFLEWEQNLLIQSGGSQRVVNLSQIYN